MTCSHQFEKMGFNDRLPSEFGFGMMRMLEILLEDVCIVKPFHDYDAAEQWLRDLRETGT